jgi:hypothetical protein
MSDPVWLCVVRLSCPQWYAFLVTPFLVGYFVGGDSTVDWRLGVSLTIVVLGSIITDLSNRLADRVEDRLDYPLRAALMDRVGVRRLYAILVTVVVVFLITFSLSVWFYLPYAATGLGFLGLMVALGYSFGPRLKKRRIVGPVHYGAISAGGLMFGSLHHGDWQTALPTVMVLWAFGMTLIGWKDVDNIVSDSSVGFRSIYRDISESKRSRTIAQMMVGAPYILLVALVLGQEMPLRALAVTVLLVPGLHFATLLLSASTAPERRGMRELGVLYWQLFMSGVLMALDPSLRTLLILALSLGWWVVMARYLNCDPPGLTYMTVQALAELHRRTT